MRHAVLTTFLALLATASSVVAADAKRELDKGLQLMKERKYKEAMPHLRKAIAEASDRRLKLNAMVRLCYTLRGTGALDEAVRTADMILKEFGDDPKLSALCNDAHYIRVSCHSNRGDYEKAKESYEMLVEKCTSRAGLCYAKECFSGCCL